MSAIPVDPVVQLPIKDWLARIDSKIDGLADRLSALEQQNKVRAGITKAASVGLAASASLASLVYTLVRLHG